MPFQVTWLPEAVKDIARLREFIQNKNPVAAKRAAARIKEATRILFENPQAGKPVDALPNFRELYVAFGSGNYVLKYRIEDNFVVIVRVKHSREDSSHIKTPS